MCYDLGSGSVAEWLKAHAWNACMRATVSEVRILSLPPGGKYHPLVIFCFLKRSGDLNSSSLSSIARLLFSHPPPGDLGKVFF